MTRADTLKERGRHARKTTTGPTGAAIADVLESQTITGERS